ncbi:ORF119 [Spodoptera frugiperda granulovirus]|uniref:ORF119 n=1 Tax=Spodoptera frugiperda granulovirus TaxID=307454 RepID=A0A0C5B391_9BBAC|nr:ORF119 [Spodoptera frugiperda granulovirus]AJK91780.1 ORF119 [Spodoptera frugiperda granulovirus]AXS01143.1 ORF123 [Spodoptera frugiperda granulovirus]
MGLCCDNCLDLIETNEYTEPHEGCCGCRCCIKMCHYLCTLMFLLLLGFVGYYCYLYKDVVLKTFGR